MLRLVHHKACPVPTRPLPAVRWRLGIWSPSREVNREFTWCLLVTFTNINSPSPYIFFKTNKTWCAQKILPLAQILQGGTEPNLAPGSLDIRYALHLVPGQQRRKQCIVGFVLCRDVPRSMGLRGKRRAAANGIAPALSFGKWQETAAC